MRTLLFILLPISASAQHYFVVPTTNNAENKAQAVSARFYRLSRPLWGDSTKYLFSYVTKGDSVAIEIDSTLNIQKSAILNQHITDWITEVYGASLTTTQRNTLTTYINSNPILRVSRLIINSRLKLWTKAEMEARGWFNYPNLIQ